MEGRRDQYVEAKADHPVPVEVGEPGHDQADRDGLAGIAHRNDDDQVRDADEDGEPGVGLVPGELDQAEGEDESADEIDAPDLEPERMGETVQKLVAGVAAREYVAPVEIAGLGENLDIGFPVGAYFEAKTDQDDDEQACDAEHRRGLDAGGADAPAILQCPSSEDQEEDPIGKHACTG